MTEQINGQTHEEFYSDQYKVFNLLEGICPECHGEVEIIEANGEAEFLAEHSAFNCPNVTVWDKGVTERGELKFKCQKGHINYAYCTFGGDWTA